MQFWGNAAAWQQLPATHRAAAMALLEADSVGGRPDMHSAKNALGAMLNRAAREGQDLGRHVSRPSYQPTIEPAQFLRLQRIVNSPEHKELVKLAEMRQAGMTPDWVGGNTHFLAKEPVMEALTRREPGKYRSWTGWSGYNRGGGQYTNPDGAPVFRDKSHAFLAPDGRHNANYGYDPENEAAAFADRPNPEAFTKPGARPAAPAPIVASDPNAPMAKASGDPNVPMMLGNPPGGGAFDPSQYAKLEIGAKRSQLMAKLLTEAALDKDTPKSHLEGLSRVVAGLVGGHQMSKEDKFNLDRRSELASQLSGLNLTPAERMASMSGNPDTIAPILGKRDELLQVGPNTTVVKRGNPTNPIMVTPGTDGSKPVPYSTLDKEVKESARAGVLGGLVNTFKPQYAGYGSGIAGDAVNKIGRSGWDWMLEGLGASTPEKKQEWRDAAAWWQNYKDIENDMRHKLFGSALTSTEAKQWELATIEPGMDPEMIKRNLQRREEIARHILEKKARSMAYTYDPRQLEEMYGFEPGYLKGKQRALTIWDSKDGPRRVPVPGAATPAPSDSGAYTPPPSIQRGGQATPPPAPAVQPLPPDRHAGAIEEAKAAIAKRPDKKAEILRRLQDMGVNTNGL